MSIYFNLDLRQLSYDLIPALTFGCFSELATVDVGLRTLMDAVQAESITAATC